MIRIILSGHSGFYGLTDILRLFYGRPVENREEGYIECESIKDMTIVSEFSGDKVSTYVVEERSKWEEVIRGRFGEEQLELKREIKRQLYLVLSTIENKAFPWGSLTGIRPTLVAAEGNTIATLCDKYLVSEKKAKLCLETEEKENKILSLEDVNSLNVYVGIPFCPSRCAYCSFISKDIHHHMNKLHEYASALCHEIEIISKKMPEVSTLYVGGGTPTVLGEEDFEMLLRTISTSFRFKKNSEITVEAGRPDTITKSKLESMVRYGIKRICINPQTMSDSTLRKYNRRHSSQDIIDVYRLARETGIDIINMDLIAGLNEDYPEELLDSLRVLIELEPENITIHTLYKKRLSAISRDNVLGGKSVGDSIEDQRLERTLDEAYVLLEDNGYKPYYLYRQKDTSHGLENVGFARVGTECRYNVAMMSDKRDVVAFGAGAVCKRLLQGGRIERCSAAKDVILYMNNVEDFARRKIAFFDGFEGRR